MIYQAGTMRFADLVPGDAIVSPAGLEIVISRRSKNDLWLVRNKILKAVGGVEECSIERVVIKVETVHPEPKRSCDQALRSVLDRQE